MLKIKPVSVFRLFLFEGLQEFDDGVVLEVDAVFDIVLHQLGHSAEPLVVLLLQLGQVPLAAVWNEHNVDMSDATLNFL